MFAASFVANARLAAGVCSLYQLYKKLPHHSQTSADDICRRMRSGPPGLASQAGNTCMYRCSRPS